MNTSFASSQITTSRNDSTLHKKVVFILIDGISADMLKKAETPFLDAISKVGSYTDAYVGGMKNGYSETPTISAVGYNSMLTGTWANKHNVWGNAIKKPNYSYPTIFSVLKDNHPKKKIAIFSTWQDNRTKLIGEGLSDTGNLRMDYAFDGFELDTISFPHDPQRQFIKNIDKKVGEEAARYIKEDGPDLSWVYLEFSDDMGHKYGDSPKFFEAITFEDKLIGGIWDAVREREKNFNENWLIIITTDHGRSAKDGKGHGGQSDRERSTWIVTNEPDTNSYFNEQVPAIVDIMPTIQRFMDLKVPQATAYEIDGVPLIGKVDVFGLEAWKKTNGNLKISWQCVGKPTEEATILMTNTNAFKDGGKDIYRAVATVPVTDKEFVIQNPSPSDIYKIVLRTKSNTSNTWLLENKKSIH